MEKVDIAINIFAKPYQTALSLLSLADKSGRHLGRIWFQFEPVGSMYDKLNPYLIVKYLAEMGIACSCSQPERWLDLEPANEEMLKDFSGRSCIRYENAFEHSEAGFLFLIHNDIFVWKDLLGELKKNIGDAFAIGQLGQCWNCPASHTSITSKIMGGIRCRPDSYQEFKPTIAELRELYRESDRQGIFKRPYDAENFSGEFATRPWPLPECRVNEWACLLNLDLARPLCIPHGDAWPPGAYRICAGQTLDVGVAFFRDLHARGLHARNFDLKGYMQHWVGTGKNTPIKYARAEDNARRLLERHYPDFLKWAKGRQG